MLTVLQFKNPFDHSFESAELTELPDGLSVSEVLEILSPGFINFEHPTICLVNGTPTMRSLWKEKVTDSSHVAFIRLAGAVVVAIIAIVLVVATTAYVLTRSTSAHSSSPAAAAAAIKHQAQKNGDSVYTLSGAKNQNKLNNAIECTYGRNKIFPAYAAQPYSLYIGNEQYQYSLFCLGHGQFSIESMFFENTPISSLEGITTEVIGPGGLVTLFADDINTSADVSGIELFGTNEDAYNNWTSGYAANNPHTLTTSIQVDIEFPKGLYNTNATTGQLTPATVTAAFQYASIDDSGALLTGWTPLLNISVTLATLTPQRKSYSAAVPSGRYSVRAVRTNASLNTVSSGDQILWDQLRAALPVTKSFGNVTIIAVSAKATNNLNNDAQARFNVIATRMLNVWNGVTWSLRATRNPCWAFCDVFLASYGGNIPASFLNLDEILANANYFSIEGINFDYTFDQQVTVWDAAKSIALVGTAIPVLDGSKITIIRDYLRMAATAVFNQYNIVSGSFAWNIKLLGISEFNGAVVEYQDNETWNTETVLCTIGSETGSNPEQLKFPGCTDRDSAYRLGLYYRSTVLYNRETIEFKTGLEGFLPRYGDLIYVVHDVPAWGSGGTVASISGRILTLVEPVTFTPGVTNNIVLRLKDGSIFGPVSCISLSGLITNQVLLSADVDYTQFYFDSSHDLPYYLFGPTSLESKHCDVIDITPNNDGTVTILCVNHDARIYDDLTAIAPAIGTTQRVINDSSLPTIRILRIQPIPGKLNDVQVQWPPVTGVTDYVLEQSPDGVAWFRVATTKTHYVTNFAVANGLIYLRVAGLNGTRLGPWTSCHWNVGKNITAPPGTTLNVHVPVVLGITIKTIYWDATPYADYYLINFFDYNDTTSTSTNILYSVTVEGLSFDCSGINWISKGATGTHVDARIYSLNFRGAAVGVDVLVPI